TALFLAVAALIYVSHLPEVRKESGNKDESAVATESGLRGLWPHKHLLKGGVAQFFYVGAQVGVASFIIRFAQYSLPGTPEKHAANYLKMHLLGFMIGRFSGSAIMKHVAPSKLLSFFGVASLGCLAVIMTASGVASMAAI